MKTFYPALIIALFAAGNSHAFTIALDYSDDTTGFFSNAAARSSIEAAASDLSRVITSTLSPITTNTYSGTNGSTTQTFTWGLSYTNPTSGAEVDLANFTSPANTYTVYVGAQHLTGSELGKGGIGGVSLSSSASGFGSQLAGAVAAAQNASNAGMQRGSQVVFGSLDGSTSLGSTTANYHVSYAPIIGNVWFNNDTNKDGFTDDTITLNKFWQFDHLTAVAAGKNDFYSVALHELIHSLGFSGAESYLDKVSGANWSGTAAAAKNGGSGTGLLTSDGAHIREGLISTTLVDGMQQEAAEDPTFTTGTRKYLTEMDLAFLQDMGYQVVPEPKTQWIFLAGLGGMAGVGLLRRARRVS